MSYLAADKWVRIMADYSADGVWAKDGCSVGIEDLPVSEELRGRILGWQHLYDDECEDYLPANLRTISFDDAAFSKQGLEIAIAVKTELPDWTVVYFDEARSNMVPALDYEYEIRVGG